MNEICNLTRRSTSRSPIIDTTITHRAAVKNWRKNAIFARFRSRREEYHLYRKSENGKRDEILRKKLHISYLDQLEKQWTTTGRQKRRTSTNCMKENRRAKG